MKHRQFCGFITLSGFLLVLYATLFPFDFVIDPGRISPGDILGNFDLSLTNRYVLGDFPGNVLLFIPFGFGLACWGKRKKLGHIGAAALVLVVSFGLSLTVEVLQTFLLRYSTIVDILANTLGAFTGFLTISFFEREILGLATILQASLRKILAGSRSIFALTIYLGLVIFISSNLQEASALNNWDPNYPLLLGNERTGDRPWEGNIQEVFFTDRALNLDEVAQVFSGVDPSTLAGDSLIARYQLRKNGLYEDQTGNLPFLIWQGVAPITNNDSGAQIKSGQWLESAETARFLTQKIGEKNQFTLSVLLASDKPEQEGQARIVSISADPYHRNLSLGQQGSDLFLRIRTPSTGDNGRNPELVIPNVFQDTNPLQIVVTYQGSTIRVYINNETEAYTFSFGPRVMLFWLIHPIQLQQIRINSSSMLVFNILYYALILVPLSYFLLTILTKQNLSQLELVVRK